MSPDSLPVLTRHRHVAAWPRARAAESKSTKGAGKTLRRVSDGLRGTVSDADLWEVRLEPAEQTLYFNGRALEDETLLSSLGLVQNEKIYLSFRAPYDPPEWQGPPPGKAGGGKKKK